MDIKSEFKKELKALLQKYDAQIDFDYEGGYGRDIEEERVVITVQKTQLELVSGSPPNGGGIYVCDL